MKYLKFFSISFFIIILDQLTKMMVHHWMILGSNGQIKLIGNWFKLHYTLNPGMAFGMAFGGEYGKLFLSVFSIIAMFGIGYYLFFLIKSNLHPGLLICVSMIFGGALGNIIDRTFYGIWLDNAPSDAITPFLHGQVIDMFYIDIWEGIVPQWFPFLGGQYYSLWPIFNIADASIFSGVVIIFIFHNRFF